MLFKMVLTLQSGLLSARYCYKVWSEWIYLLWGVPLSRYLKDYYEKYAIVFPGHKGSQQCRVMVDLCVGEIVL